MITEIVLRILLVIIAISFVQIAYNTFVYKQRGKMKWIKFLFVAIPTVIVGYLLFNTIRPFTELKYVSFVVGAIDSIVFTFFGYLPKKFILVWFVAPLFFVWIIYLITTFITVVKNKYKYMKWKKRVNIEEKEFIQENTTNSNQTRIDDMTENVEIEEYGQDEKNIHFLNEPMTKIRYQSILGLQRAYEVAKTKGLQITETETGYVAVYSDKAGVKKLKELLSQNGIDYRELENRPSIVFFNLDTVKCLSIKEALEKMNGGESIVE